MDQMLAMRVFARVVETGSLSRAADSLDLPRASATRLVQRLEKHLQLTLLQRTTRRVVVTPDGFAYYARVSALLKDLADIEATVGRAQSSAGGSLRVDVAGGIATQVLIPKLQTLFRKQPELRLELGVTDRPVDVIGERVDCVIRCGPLSDRTLVARTLAQLHSVTCASPAYLKRHGTPGHPRDLGTSHVLVPYISPQTGRQELLRLARRSESVEVRGRYALAVNDVGAQLAAALNGLGVVHTFQFMARKFVARGELVPLLTEWKAERVPLYVVYPPTRHPSARLRLFVDWIVEACKGLG
jgi:DNA-binding transcriptional LysR family regulator